MNPDKLADPPPPARIVWSGVLRHLGYDYDNGQDVDGRFTIGGRDVVREAAQAWPDYRVAAASLRWDGDTAATCGALRSGVEWSGPMRVQQGRPADGCADGCCNDEGSDAALIVAGSDLCMSLERYDGETVTLTIEVQRVIPVAPREAVKLAHPWQGHWPGAEVEVDRYTADRLRAAGRVAGVEYGWRRK